MSTQSKKDALMWFKENEPFIYATAMKRLEMENAEMGAINWGSIGSSVGKAFNSLATTVSNLAPQVLQFKQQKEVMDMQMKRAEKGLPPADVADYSPVIKIQPNITPETEAAVTRAATQVTKSATQKMLPFILGGAGLLAVMLLKRRGR